MTDTNTSARARFGYLTYNDMLQRIDEYVLDAYDICFTKDTNECFIITEELEPSPIRSRVYVFENVDEAIEILNQNADTYNGQVVAILQDSVYRGYIVNTIDDKFMVTPLYEQPEPIDYDTLGDRPIINIVGTLDKPVMVSELTDGVYKIKGQYKISDLEDTIYLSATDILFMVRNESDEIKIKKITSDNIIDYFIKDLNLYKSTYVTDDYLKNNNIATESYVDSKIEALELSMKKDMETYVSGIIDDVLGDTLDAKINEQIKESFQPITESQILDLF